MNNVAAGVAARFAVLDALRQREVAVFGPSTPGQTRTPNEGNGTPKRNTFLPRGESRIAPEQQKEQQSTSSTSQTPSAPRHPETFYMLESLMRSVSYTHLTLPTTPYV